MDRHQSFCCRVGQKKSLLPFAQDIDPRTGRSYTRANSRTAGARLGDMLFPQALALEPPRPAAWKGPRSVGTSAKLYNPVSAHSRA